MQALTARAAPAPMLVSHYLATAGEEYGRACAEIILDRADTLAAPGMADTATAIVIGAGLEMAEQYRLADCSKRQVRAFLRGFQFGATLRFQQAQALLMAAASGEA